MEKARLSFKGWKFGEWLKGHWKTIKEVAKPLIPYYIAWSNGLDPQLSVVVAALGAGLLSAIEYFVKEYK